MLRSLSASASRVASTGADRELYNLLIVFLKNVLIFYYMIFINFSQIFSDKAMIKKTFLADGTIFKRCIGSVRNYFRYDPSGGTSKRSFIDVKKCTLKMATQSIKLYHKLTIYRCKNDKNTPRNGGFYQKNDESVLWSGDSIDIKPMKTY